MNSDPWADDLEQPRNDVYLHIQVIERPDQRQRALMCLSREGEHDPLDLQLADKVGQLVGPPEQRHLFEAGPNLSLVDIDEAEELEAILGVMPDFSCDKLPHF